MMADNSERMRGMLEAMLGALPMTVAPVEITSDMVQEAMGRAQAWLAEHSQEPSAAEQEP